MANLNIWGDSTTFQKMFESFANGQSKYIQLGALQNGQVRLNGNGAGYRKEAEELVLAYINGQKTAMQVAGVADNVSSEVKHLIQEFVKTGGATVAGLGLLFKTLTGKEAESNDIEKLSQLAETLQ